MIKLDHQVEETPFPDGVLPPGFPQKIGKLKMLFIQLVRVRGNYNRDIKKPKFNDVFIPGLSYQDISGAGAGAETNNNYHHNNNSDNNGRGRAFGSGDPHGRRRAL